MRGKEFAPSCSIIVSRCGRTATVVQLCSVVMENGDSVLLMLLCELSAMSSFYSADSSLEQTGASAVILSKNSYTESNY